MSARGFTLVEVLVALFGLGLIAAAGAAILSQSLSAKDAIGHGGAALRDLQLAHAMLKADLGQIAPRPVRDAFGGRGAVSFRGGRGEDPQAPLLAFVRRGWENPGAAAARASMQYVEYAFRDGRLIRRARPALDPAPQTPETRMVQLEGVRALRIEFAAGGNWIPAWTAGAGAPRASLPEAVALTADLGRLGTVRQLFLTPAAP